MTCTLELELFIGDHFFSEKQIVLNTMYSLLMVSRMVLV